MKRYEKAMAIAVISILIVGLLTVMVLLMGIVAKAEFVVAESGLRVRKEPNLDAEVIKVVPYRTEVEGTISDGWMKTEDGFVSAEFLSETDPLAEAQFLGTWRVTAYAATGNMTASGTWPEVGRTVASNQLEFGTAIYIEGVGIRYVTDRGPQSMGNQWLDLYLGDTESCILFGDQMRNVYIVNTP